MLQYFNCSGGFNTTSTCHDRSQELDELARDALQPEDQFEDFNFLLDGGESNPDVSIAAASSPTAAADTANAATDDFLRFDMPTSPGQDAALEF